MSKEFKDFYIWLKRELNIELSGYKQRQLQRRITTVMTKSGAKDLKAYARYIKEDEKIKHAFLDYITINVTEFYRNPEIFSEFEEILINQIANKSQRLKIWSAASSTGAEAYSVAMALKKNNLIHKSTIIGTDIDEGILQKAQEGRYSKLEVKNVPEDEMNRYFKEVDRYYELSNDIKKLVRFKKHDLILDSYDKNYHVIICRNVTIYFNDEVKDNIYQKISDSLVIGGLYFIGATETIYQPEKFGLRKIGSFVYEKYE